MGLHRILGWIHIVLSGACLVAGAGLCLTLAVDTDPRALMTLSYVGPLFVFFAVPILLPSIIGGIGLVRGARWAQVLIGVWSGLLLLAFPVGTVLGAFGLWVLVVRPSPAPAATVTRAPAAPVSKPAASAEARRLLRLLVAATTVALGFIVVIGAGFRLTGQPSPLGASFWPALVALVAILVFVVVKRPFAADPRPQTLNPISQARLRGRLRREAAQVQEQHRLRLTALAADPATAPYAALMAAGEYWSDEQIAYDRDPAARETCIHLAPIEGAMREAGLQVRYGWAPHQVNARCRIDEAALIATFAPALSVAYEEFYASERAREDLPMAHIRCLEHASGISVRHPEEAGVDAPWFPASDGRPT